MRLTLDLGRSRVEAKYAVDAGDVTGLLRRIPAGEREDYGVRTLYFDRPDGSLAREALDDPLHCTKVRAREYGNGSPWVWFEAKSRRGRWTRKSRLRLTRAEAARLASGGALPDRIAGLEDDPDGRSLLEEGLRGGLVPVGSVAAFRRSFFLKRELVRITIDLDIAYHGPGRETSGRPGPLLRREPEPVLELKHAGSVPDSCRALLEGLRPSDYSKFRNLVRSLAEAAEEAGRVDRL